MLYRRKGYADGADHKPARRARLAPAIRQELIDTSQAEPLKRGTHASGRILERR